MHVCKSAAEWCDLRAIHGSGKKDNLVVELDRKEEEELHKVLTFQMKDELAGGDGDTSLEEADSWKRWWDGQRKLAVTHDLV